VLYVLSQYWLFAALAALLGVGVGWFTCATGRPGGLGWPPFGLGWLPYGLGAFALGLVVALVQIVPGLPGHALEIALYLFAAYIAGCALGCVAKGALTGSDAAPAARAGTKPVARAAIKPAPKGAPAAAKAGKSAALAGVDMGKAKASVLPARGETSSAAKVPGAAAGAATLSAREAREAAKAKARAQADAKSHAKFLEEEAARAKAEAERQARERAEAEAKARAEAELAAREEELARSGGVTTPARDFSVSRGDTLIWIDRVGPHTESRLNALGIRKFAQIADWTPSNGRWIDEKLGEPGRVAREDWVAQARRLAAGETTDHARAVRAGTIRIDDAPPAPAKPEKKIDETAEAAKAEHAKAEHARAEVERRERARRPSKADEKARIWAALREARDKAAAAASDAKAQAAALGQSVGQSVAEAASDAAGAAGSLAAKAALTGAGAALLAVDAAKDGAASLAETAAGAVGRLRGAGEESDAARADAPSLAERAAGALEGARDIAAKTALTAAGAALLAGDAAKEGAQALAQKVGETVAAVRASAEPVYPPPRAREEGGHGGVVPVPSGGRPK
jgi:predicted flap endonuclease-1-like 5' DNA nuclease